MNLRPHKKFLRISLAMNLLFSWSSLASFSLSNGVITQTGIDTDLSGLAAISGVTTSTSAGITTYHIGNRYLNFDGTQTIDGMKERVVSSVVAVTAFRINGTLNVQSFYEEGGEKKYVDHKVLVADGISSTSSGSPGLYFGANGVLNADGGWIEVSYVSAANTNQPNLHFNITRLTVGSYELNSSINNFIYLLTPNINITGKLILIKMSFIPRAVIANFSEYESHYDASVIVSSASPNTEHVFQDFNNTPGFDAARLWAGKKIKFLNTVRGSDYGVTNNNQGNGDSRGTVLFFKEVSASFKDTDGNVVENAKTFIKDYDNGNRTDGNGYTFSTDRTYFKTSDASGDTPSEEVLVAVVNEPGYDATPDFDYRGKNGDTTDVMDMYFWSYNYLPSQTEISLKGIGVNNIDWTLFDDENITESNSATVAGYTTIDNLDELYDYAKYWKTLNATNIEYPSVSEYLAQASGTELDLGSISLVVDANATEAFSIDKVNHIITIKAATLMVGTKFSSITTTGTVSTANNATLEFGYVHSGGTQKYLELTGLTSADVMVTNNQPATPVGLGSTTNQTGTYKLSFPAPADASDVEIKVTRNGYTTWIDSYPENNLSLTRNVLQYQREALVQKQLDMLNYALRIMQKQEAVNAALGGSTPNLTVNNTITSSSTSATEENQDAILQLLKRILVKSTISNETLKEQ